MAGYRIDRITSDIKLALSELLRNMKDPRVSRLLSIVKVDVSGRPFLCYGLCQRDRGLRKNRKLGKRHLKARRAFSAASWAHA